MSICARFSSISGAHKHLHTRLSTSSSSPLFYTHTLNVVSSLMIKQQSEKLLVMRRLIFRTILYIYILQYIDIFQFFSDS